MNGTKIYLLGIRKYYEDYSVTTVLWDNVHLGSILDEKGHIKVKCGKQKVYEVENFNIAIKVFADHIKNIYDKNTEVFYKEIEVDMLNKDTFEEVK